MNTGKDVFTCVYLKKLKMAICKKKGVNIGKHISSCISDKYLKNRVYLFLRAREGNLHIILTKYNG